MIRDEYLSTPLAELRNHLLEGKRDLQVTGMKGSYGAFALATLALEVPQIFLIITSDNDAAEELCQELRFYLGEEHALERPVCFFPSWETLPYDKTEPHQEKVISRIESLHTLRMSEYHPIVVAPLRALMQRCLPPSVLDECVISLQVDQEIDRDELMHRLLSLGYRQVPLVEEPGEFSVRGGIVDLYPPRHTLPVRAELFGDTVESLRLFHPVTQRSLSSVGKTPILPVSEIIVNEATAAQALATIEKRKAEEPIPARLIKGVQEKIGLRAHFSGISFLMEFFYEHPGTLFDYLSDQVIAWFTDVGDWRERVDSFFDTVASARAESEEEGNIASLGSGLYLTPQELAAHLEVYARVRTGSLTILEGDATAVSFSTSENVDLYRNLVDKRSEARPLAQLVKLFREWLDDYYSIVLVTHSETQKRRFHDLLEEYALIVQGPASLSLSRLGPSTDGIIQLTIGQIQRGFRSAADRIAILTEAEVFGERQAQRKRVKVRDAAEAISSLEDLKVDECVVHVDYGIGRYKGLHSLDIGGSRSDFLLIEYRDDDRLYVPAHRLNLVQKYRGVEDEIPPLSKLGGTAWGQTKKKIKESIQAHAKELLKIYASRQALTGYSFSARDDDYRVFEARFEFDETADQMSAIEDVIEDMERNRPMDRLVCGDTGYGKTEVALRAAFKAVSDAKQVTLLVPTTVLAHQHYQTFSRRFRDFPIIVGMLSRFQAPREQKRIIEEAKQGKIDILIGTHRLLQKDVGFKDLGLVIIDEEHRFGVQHKEKFKRMRELVDVLTMTATPIPRTLQLSMLGIRDLSIINSPPENRLAVKTFITHFDEKVVREAVIREFLRDGQVFFVHNRVERIESMADMLQKIVPEARLAIAHGQMQEKELEAVMLAFQQREVNLLLCTSIIESGLDFPNANTIIINRSDKMGLAQLYQLRGRVGRSNHQAYAYFLVPGEQLLTSKGKKRLEALAEFSDLSSGFRLASYDLEIRGGGNILGLSQSGHMNQVGIELYYELIEKAVKEIKGEKVLPEIDPEIKVRIPAYIPEEYVPDIHQRLRIYKKLAGGLDDEAIADVRSELRDRFGAVPAEVENLLLISGVKRILKELLVTSLEYSGGTIVLAFNPEDGASFDKVLALLQNHGNRLRFTPDHKLLVPFSQGQSWEAMVEKIKELLG